MSTFDHYVTGLRYTSNTQTSPFLSLCVYVPLCWWCKLEPHHNAITVFQAHMPTNPHTVRVHPEPESQFNLGHMLQNWFWAGTYCTLLWTSVGHTFSCSKLLNCSLIIQSGIQCLLNNPWPTSYHWCSRRSFLDRLSKTYRKLTVQFDPSNFLTVSGAHSEKMNCKIHSNVFTWFYTVSELSWPFFLKKKMLAWHIWSF